MHATALQPPALDGNDSPELKSSGRSITETPQTESKHQTKRERKEKKVSSEKKAEKPEKAEKDTASDLLALLNANATPDSNDETSGTKNSGEGSNKERDRKSKTSDHKKKRRRFLPHLKRGDEMSEPGQELARITAERTETKKNAAFKMPWEEEPAANGDKGNASNARATASNSEDEPIVNASAPVKAPSAYAPPASSPQTRTQVSPQIGTETANSIFGTTSAFTTRERPLSKSSLIGGLFNASASTTGEATGATTGGESSTTQEHSQATVVKLDNVKLDNDQWAKKLKDLVEHGTNSLKEGEAFMFAEDTGEASLFLSDGTTIRRIVQQPKDAQEVMRQRRPDIAANADEMLYGLSLLGKLIPKFDTQTPSPSMVSQPPDPLGTFHGDNLMSNSQTFWGWLKSVLKF
jgi:hypothetical protein